MRTIPFHQLTSDEKYEHFMERIENNEKMEAEDWMPDEYRKALIRLISMHGISEIMGALPEKEWVPKAPTLYRKLAIMAKVQDEMGHGQLLLRVVEDLIKPFGKTREHLLQDLFTKRLKFHNVFHMPAPSWGDAAIIAWLVDGAAILSQTMMLNTSYGPYGRALKRICQEESFHAKHGESLTLALASGTGKQKDMLQAALDRWWESLLTFFGPKSKQETGHSNVDISLKYKLRTKTNEQLRQEFLTKYVPKIELLGLTIPDENLHFDKSKNEWCYTEPDWEKFKMIVSGNGPESDARIDLRKNSYQNSQWVRDALKTYRENRSELIG
ncbi:MULTISPECIES: 1,2-phenylacetyl-CoA epoxidase subunit PaaA [Clostridia]|uniref:1,2-phenylacetyl-CoA epoxidase subunit PaaA n=1 Tax=Clostridia TaxID=186801 RepID=UPI000EA4029A|nr:MULTISPECIES: 1,2-phenylacetyl-CoA epoxidase subunit PaaA [Clostridia]NBJ68096.1 1,2-phenylacetyl-CoA epoxidase subunit A [Roseburia sp. 1XD42-34]RKI81872.1 1,2-phenylacetyl-CoA epoxidase subunit A [Clostridium sp. 1xD42-85]